MQSEKPIIDHVNHENEKTEVPIANHNSNRFVGDPGLQRQEVTAKNGNEPQPSRARVNLCFTCGQNHGKPWCRGPQKNHGNLKKQNQGKKGKKQTTEHQVNKALYQQIQKQQGEIDALSDISVESANSKAEEEELARAIEETRRKELYEKYLEERFEHILKMSRSWVEPHNCNSLLSIVPFVTTTVAVGAGLSTSTGRRFVSTAASSLVDLATNGKSQGFAASMTALLGGGALRDARTSLFAFAFNGLANIVDVVGNLKKRDTCHKIEFVHFTDYKHQDLDLRADDNATSDMKHDDPHYAVFEYTVHDMYLGIPHTLQEKKRIVVSLELASQAKPTARVGHSTELEQAWLSFERACQTNKTVNVSKDCEERSTRDLSWNVRHNTAFFLLCLHKYNTAVSPKVGFQKSRSLV